MNKKLEAWERIKATVERSDGDTDVTRPKDLLIVEAALKREDSIEITAIDIEQDNKELCKENKKLKRVLEIIKEKNVNLGLIKISKSVEEYNKWALTDNLFVDIDQRTLTQEEYNLLKEVLK